MKDLYRLVYTSNNLLEGSERERAEAIAAILATSQRNNSKVGVTGALLFNGGCFAQVLEGPRKAVETTFERIQRDPRHSDVSVLQCEAVEVRGFPNWSMAFTGHSARGRALWNEIASRTGFDLSRIEGDHLFATLHAIVEAEEGPISDTQPVTPALTPVVGTSGSTPKPELVVERGEPMNVERVRSELLDRTAGRAAPTKAEALPVSVESLLHPADRSEDKKAPALDGLVLRAALAEERQRTTDLRQQLDEARIALAILQDDAETLRRQRDHWAERARALASVLCQEPAPSPRSNAERREPGMAGTRAVA